MKIKNYFIGGMVFYFGIKFAEYLDKKLTPYLVKAIQNVEIEIVEEEPSVEEEKIPEEEIEESKPETMTED